VAKTLLDSPDFLRLGLRLALERRPSEATARTKFLEVREIARHRVQEALNTLAPNLPDPPALPRHVPVPSRYSRATSRASCRPWRA
jgi:hypothetical protein